VLDGYTFTMYGLRTIHLLSCIVYFLVVDELAFGLLISRNCSSKITVMVIRSKHTIIKHHYIFKYW